jgi:hypothetical protein
MSVSSVKTSRLPIEDFSGIQDVARVEGLLQAAVKLQVPFAQGQRHVPLLDQAYAVLSADRSAKCHDPLEDLGRDLG